MKIIEFCKTYTSVAYKQRCPKVRSLHFIAVTAGTI